MMCVDIRSSIITRDTHAAKRDANAMPMLGATNRDPPRNQYEPNSLPRKRS